LIAYDITLGADAVKITVIGILQAAGIFALAPLLTGVMRKVKAKRQKRVGASVIQPYYDLLKLLKKDEVVSEHASWVFQWTPWIVAASTMSAALFIPIFVPFSPVSSAGDILVVLGLFALARFFVMLAGIDTPSAFGGIFLTVFVISLTFGGTNLTSLVGAAAQSGVVIAPSVLFGFIAFFIITLAETGRLPFDNPATHLELTMVHEAMVLEYSGRGLALIQWSQSIKQLLLLGLMVDLFLPIGMPASADASLALLGFGAAAVVVKVVLLAVVISYLETRVAKWRLFRLPDLFTMAIASAMVGMIVFYL